MRGLEWNDDRSVGRLERESYSVNRIQGGRDER